MSSYTGFYGADRLYRLLPEVYRQRDAEAGYPLLDFVGVLAREARVVEADIEDLYEGWFIETCPDWLVPYLGDLVGVDGLSADTFRGRLNRRAEVANTLRLRQRKGTAGVLEQLARDVTGWPARAVEFFQRLGTTQHLNHPRPHNLRTPALRDAGELELLASPFNGSARSFEARRIEPRRGCYNVANVGLFLWRLAAYPVRLGEPRRLAPGEPRFTVSPLRNDSPLFHLPHTEEETAQLAGELHVPGPIRRRALHGDLEAFYGSSFTLFEDVDGEWTRIGPEKIEACDLSDWERPVGAGTIAVDPHLGRIKAGSGAEPEGGLRVSYHYGFSDDLGGGSYERSAGFSSRAGSQTLVVGPAGRDEEDPGAALRAALDEAMARLRGATESVTVVIADSRTYPVELGPAPGVVLELPAGRHLEIRAANRQRPVLLLPDFNLVVEGGAGSALRLDGLLISGLPLIARGELGRLTLRHCTVVPGQALAPDGRPLVPGGRSLRVEGGSVEVLIERCILGGLDIDPRARVEISDSVLDVHGRESPAYFRQDGAAGGPLTVRRSTIIGRVETRRLELAENCLFLGPVVAQQRQQGCVRFCHVPPASRVPRRYRCQPEVPEGASAEQAARLADSAYPRFTSLRYGDPAYCQLDWRGPREILRGGDGESEMGVFSSLLQPQREDALRVRLDEYLRLGLEAGILFVT